MPSQKEPLGESLPNTAQVPCDHRGQSGWKPTCGLTPIQKGDVENWTHIDARVL